VENICVASKIFINYVKKNKKKASANLLQTSLQLSGCFETCIKTSAINVVKKVKAMF